MGAADPNQNPSNTPDLSDDNAAATANSNPQKVLKRMKVCQFSVEKKSLCSGSESSGLDLE